MTPSPITRRRIIAGTLSTLAVTSLPRSLGASASAHPHPWRAINIVNFIRATEPREPMDLFLPVREQMAIIKAHKFAATWLLQYDAMIEGPFVDFLKAEMPPEHEVGIWFEMNRDICNDAGIAWRGRSDWEWDYHVPVAYAIGYTPDERRKLADTAMATFKRIVGKPCKSVASWNLDAITIAHLSDNHAIDAFANCRDQLATDGFTIWGAPIAAYYPCRNNAWSPAIEAQNQINTPMFRMLGQDPVYYYDNQVPRPDTMEPVWPSGRSEIFMDRFLKMIAEAPTQSLAYAQLGQENSFGWPEMQQAYPVQMDKLANEKDIIVETLGDTGRRFKRSFSSTPTQAQVMLEDPFDRRDPAERTVWYQSKFLRANLHFRGDEFYLRDLHIYDDRFPQPYLTEPVRQHGIEQRMLAVLDGYHWSDDEVRAGRRGMRAQGRFVLIAKDGTHTELTMAGLPTVSESGSTMQTSVPLKSGGKLIVNFSEPEMSFRIVDATPTAILCLIFEWVPERSALTSVSTHELHYRFRNFDYRIRIANATVTKTPSGATIIARTGAGLRLTL